MKSVSVNAEQKLYVIPCAGGYSFLGFDVAYEWGKAYAVEIGRADLMPKLEHVGTLAGYAEYQATVEAARISGKRLTAGLTPQLVGLEGKRVEVVDKYGDVRRFYVGKSTGFIPCHLEIKRRDSTGGAAVMGAPFKFVRIVSSR